MVGARGLRPVVRVKETDLVERRAASVEHYFEPLRKSRAVVRWNRHGVRLHASVDAGTIRPGDNPFTLCPSWLTRCELMGALQARLKHGEGLAHIGFRVELIEA